ncbi:DUF2970 domain-containing protein [Alteromonas lipotrueiana]|uniref:DUF2970 domain-containing protein n=1 Tax=Alteromonas lipotrueiana TaxID=2803815 RepID=UPI001FECC376|nr:DUF2970 domain-containing protein [Alteromonas lipotrueiana]|tara:strand:+ start:205 stop:402 length:198 start_codon:yes stop_codon:yes gene_type:complete
MYFCSLGHWMAVVMSVLASLFGVQSQKNYQRDFSQSSILPYIIVGVVMVILLVVMLFFLVRIITG